MLVWPSHSTIMAAIKRFFEKKLDVKFKKAGPGHSLSSDTRGPAPSGSHQSQQAASRIIIIIIIIIIGKFI